MVLGAMVMLGWGIKKNTKLILWEMQSTDTVHNGAQQMNILYVVSKLCGGMIRKKYIKRIFKEVIMTKG